MQRAARPGPGCPSARRRSRRPPAARRRCASCRGGSRRARPCPAGRTRRAAANGPSTPVPRRSSWAVSSPETGPSSNSRTRSARTDVRRSGRLAGRSSGRTARAACAATKRRTPEAAVSADAFQQSSPGMCSIRTRPPAEPRTVGTSPGSTRANAAMTSASSEAKCGVALSQTGPRSVGSRKSPARFQVRRCSTGPVTGRPAAASVRVDQSSSSRSPSIRAQGARSGSSPYNMPWIRRELEQHARTLQRLDVVRHMAVAARPRRRPRTAGGPPTPVRRAPVADAGRPARPRTTTARRRRRGRRRRGSPHPTSPTH